MKPGAAQQLVSYAVCPGKEIECREKREDV